MCDNNQRRQEIEANLSQFCGSTTFYRHPLFRGFLYTEGVQYLAEAAEAYWLIDCILSHQINPKVKNNPDLQEFQLWQLVVSEDQTAVLTCLRDTDDPVLSQEIGYTDFCLPEISFYLCNKTLMLKSEY
ncbi:hypothetical protein Pse7367_3772 (plasmid) [Thalassoporum mexicanum PCC 7367]|uniref:DUF6876 family protein n=1 Tax=Thalassoporum mexicanum TaxID=3457544 RepID=UPI00029F8F7A|nr:DUF6876 family protein [Pseudanabaena sp. PCC 7367]AFY71997.1 hypothetical protein Pse7367_3772 [Pseudanabaena sp. PCC 7367]